MLRSTRSKTDRDVSEQHIFKFQFRKANSLYQRTNSLVPLPSHPSFPRLPIRRRRLSTPALRGGHAPSSSDHAPPVRASQVHPQVIQQNNPRQVLQDLPESPLGHAPPGLPGNPSHACQALPQNPHGHAPPGLLGNPSHAPHQALPQNPLGHVPEVLPGNPSHAHQALGHTPHLSSHVNPAPSDPTQDIPSTFGFKTDVTTSGHWHAGPVDQGRVRSRFVEEGHEDDAESPPPTSPFPVFEKCPRPQAFINNEEVFRPEHGSGQEQAVVEQEVNRGQHVDIGVPPLKPLSSMSIGTTIP